MSDPKWQEEKRAFDLECERLYKAHQPYLALPQNWMFLEFSDAQREIMCGDPDIAFQWSFGEWVIRMDYSGEIGNSSCYWKIGCEAQAESEFDFFAHGYPKRPATPEELKEYRWALDAAIYNWVDSTVAFPDFSKSLNT